MRTSPFLVATLIGLFALSTSGALAAGQSRAACDAQRKQCYAGRTETGGGGVRYVPPEVVSECEGAYRVCTSGG